MVYLEEKRENTIIRVIGVGGAGGNAVSHMINQGIQGVDFICANTDAQVLARTGASVLIQLGETGLGAGANPTVGRDAALSDRERIADAIRGAHMVFVTAGMGGGTGTGAAPVIAEVAREMGILTVGVVTKPFEFEGIKRMRVASQGIEELSSSVDSMIVVLNERLQEVLGEDITQKEAFRAADTILCNAVAGIAEIINSPGMINVDFQDVCTVMSENGRAMMGSSVASGPDRARVAAERAIACPLLEGVNLSGARGLLVNITSSELSLKLREPKEVMNIIRSYAAEDATIIYGAVYDSEIGDDLRVTVVATGLSEVASKADPAFADRRQAVSLSSSGQIDYDTFDAPAVIRRREQRVASSGSGQDRSNRGGGVEVLDIPSFLRRSVE
ncbi:cell division protein FtsZ [Candidatus Ichthyocystis hellenicum]|uniref:cell division protein FtsZ n=1 Tax=Candidatus Ichthyocystis hellenicum TaxID=1561003 RepID=UPI000AF2B681|nr:cell division protein FtsZ [Candidatus Ichthyocystis hellenicum]